LPPSTDRARLGTNCPERRTTDVTTAPPPVLLVLPEGSRPDSLVDLGVAEARRQGTGLHLLRVAADAGDTDPDPEVLLATLRRRADDRSGDRVTVTSEHLSGDVVRIALDRSRTARLVIVPHEDWSVVAEEELLGTTAVGVVSGSEVPVLVVPEWWEEDEQPRGVVAVGVDEVAESGPLLIVAARQAVAREARLVVVHASPHHLLHRRRRHDGEGEVPAWLRGDFPGLAVTMRLVDGAPERELEQASQEAELVVIGRGAPGRGGQLGRTGQRVLEEASCPVLVVEPVAT
jgi:nucleotide-binding universal stress UspA family protein